MSFSKSIFRRKVGCNPQMIRVPFREPNKIVENLLKEVGLKENHTDPSCDTFFHYTSLQALHNIIQKEEVWLTKAQHMNDQSEVKNALSLYRDMISNRKTSENFHDIEMKIIKIFEREVNKLEELEKADIYILSFSPCKNMLQQWKLYGDSGAGVAIGFNREALLEDQFLNFRKCIYEKEKKEEIVRQHLNQVVQKFSTRAAKIVKKESENKRDEEIKNSATEDNLEIIKKKLKSGKLQEIFNQVIQMTNLNHAGALHHLSAFFKHEKFKREKEWRLYTHPTDERNYKLRSSNNRLIPYLPIELTDEKLINEIFIGPTAEAKLARESVNKLIEGTPFENAEVSASDIPLREL